MAITRANKPSDATWCRAWVCDTTAERATLAATWNTPGGPKRGDEVIDNQDGHVYMFTSSGSMYRTDGIGYLPIDLNADVINILPVANGGTGDNTIAQGDLYYGSATAVVSRLGKDANATRYLSNQGTSNNPSWNQVNAANGLTGVVPAANLPPTFNWQDVPYSAGNFTASGAMTWTVGSGDISVNRFGISSDEKTGVWCFSFVNYDIGGTPDAYLRIAFPFGYLPNNFFLGALGFCSDSALGQVGFAWVASGGQAYIEIGLMSGSNWATGTGIGEIDFTVMYEVQP